MNTTKYLQRLQRIDILIRRQSTGTPSQLAEKLDISERQLFNLIEDLKELGLPINYSRLKQTYYYSEASKLKIEISIENLSTQEKTNIFGGTAKGTTFLSRCKKIAVGHYMFVVS